MLGGGWMDEDEFNKIIKEAVDEQADKIINIGRIQGVAISCAVIVFLLLMKLFILR